MFDSRPKDREGEAIEDLIPEAIHTTSSTARKGPARPPTGGPGPVPRITFLAVAGLAGAEAVAIVALLAGAC